MLDIIPPTNIQIYKTKHRDINTFYKLRQTYFNNFKRGVLTYDGDDFGNNFYNSCCGVDIYNNRCFCDKNCCNDDVFVDVGKVNNDTLSLEQVNNILKAQQPRYSLQLLNTSSISTNI